MVLLIISVAVPDKAAPVGSNRPVSSSRREPSPLDDTRPYTVISLVELDEVWSQSKPHTVFHNQSPGVAGPDSQSCICNGLPS